MADPRIRNIKIHTGVVKRLAKEKSVYEIEVIQQTKKIEKMKVDGKDEHDIKKQEEVCQESRMMIPDCLKKLKVAHTKLTGLVDEAQELSEVEEYIAAKAILEETNSLVTDQSA